MALEVGQLPPTAAVANYADDVEDEVVDGTEETVDYPGGLAALRAQRERNRSALEQAFRLAEERLQGARGMSDSERRLALAANLVAPTKVPGAAGVIGTIANARLVDETNRRKQQEALEDQRAELGIKKAQALSGSEQEYDKLIAQYLGRQATQTAAAGRPQRLPITTNANNQRILTEVYRDGRTVETNLDTGEKYEVSGAGGAPAARGDAREFEVFKGITGKVGDVVVGPDKKSYRVLEGGGTKEIAGAPKGKRPATPQEAATFGFAGPGMIDVETGAFEPNKGVPSIIDQQKFFANAQSMGENAESIIAKAREVIPKIGTDTTGVIGVVQAKIPGTDAYNVAQTIETIKSNIGFDKLQNMRDNSPTGGALGQVAIQELEALQKSIASLDMGQSPEQLRRNLGEVIKRYESYNNVRRRASAQAELFRRRAGQGSGESAPQRRRFNPETGKVE